MVCPILPQIERMVNMASVYKRGKTWAYKVYYYENGKQKAVSKSGFKTKAEAKDASVKRENEMLQGKNFAKEKIYLADYMRTWKKIYKEGKVSIGVLNRIDRVIRYVEKNYNLMLKDITPDNYQEYINKLAERLSTESVIKYNEYVAGAIKHAVRTDVLVKNPCEYVKIKGNDSRTFSEETKFLSLDEYYRLYNVVINSLDPDYRSQHIILLAMVSGMRIGECLGLTWDNLDRNNCTIKIEKGFDYKITQDFTDGKTKSAKRTIVIPKEVMEILYELPQNQERIFKDITSDSVNKVLKTLLLKANIERKIRFHSLRHTHASILLSQGIQVLTVSKRLGHSNPTITMETYAHVIQELEESDNKKIMNILIHGTNEEQKC